MINSGLSSRGSSFRIAEAIMQGFVAPIVFVSVFPNVQGPRVSFPNRCIIASAVRKDVPLIDKPLFITYHLSPITYCFPYEIRINQLLINSSIDYDFCVNLLLKQINDLVIYLKNKLLSLFNR